MISLRFLAVAAALAAAAQAQTVVEHSLGTARAAGSAAGVRSAGKAAVGIFENAAKTLEKANATSLVVLPAAAGDPVKPVKFAAPDPAQIKPGMNAAELIEKFGEPAMKISGECDTWTYGSDPGAVTVKLRDRKVFSVTPPSAKKNETSADSNPSNTAVTVLR
ncbi:MAG: hypothetical protein ACM336_00965 [Acidobacteriota bacterium]